MLKTLVLGTVLLACPCAILAQRGAGGGHVGGGTAGGGGLSSTGKATGVDETDDLKGFHEVLAVQATGQQIVDYGAMMKSTEAANVELKTFLERLSGESSASELSRGVATVQQAIGRARTENKKFLDGFSERQKTGLKEVAKKLTKADADLAQQAKDLDDRVGDTKAVGSLIANSAHGLERTLTSFKNQQVDLGDEMSIGVATNRQDASFNLPPMRNSVNFANQPIAITTSGVISRGVAEGGENNFKLELTVDLSDLQANITDVLRTQLSKDSRCGERIAVRTAALSPSDPASLVLVQLHFERWACLGRDVNEMVEGNGTIEVKLTPSVGESGALSLTPKIERIDAEGLIGELLRSDSLGERLRDKIAESLLSVVRQGGDFNATLPPALRGNTTLHHAQFQGAGAGRLRVVLDGEIRVSNEQLTSVIGELKAREFKTSELQGQSSVPETAPATTPR
jgi:hypothetical protein